MSLGLVAADTDRIYLAAESEGLQFFVIPSKLRQLQENPNIAIVVAGGLDHWKHVFDSYTQQPNLKYARNEVVRLLNDNMGPGNMAFGRLSGFENDQPICYRIDRDLNTTTATWSRIILTSIVTVGREDHAQAARSHAEVAIIDGTGQEQALREAIESRIPGDDLRSPVESIVVKRV